jgi:small subunit ribosomal protein S4
LDNIIFRMGFTQSRSQARQIVRHRHVEVNGVTVNVPSFRVSGGDEIAIRTKSKNILPVEVSLEARTRPALPEWLALDEKARVGRVIRVPMRSDISFPIQEQLIVELYSK